MVMYRARKRLRGWHIPLLPPLLNRLSIICFSANIDDTIVIGEDMRIPGGKVVIGGHTRIGDRAVLGQYVSIGMRADSITGPTLGDDVVVGDRTTILGPWQIGDGAVIESDSIVTGDVPAGAVVGGIPARKRDAGPALRLVPR